MIKLPVFLPNDIVEVKNPDSGQSQQAKVIIVDPNDNWVNVKLNRTISWWYDPRDIKLIACGRKERELNANGYNE